MDFKIYLNFFQNRASVPLRPFSALTLPDPGYFITSKAQGGADSAPPCKMRNIDYGFMKFYMYIIQLILGKY